jgi:putative transposase
MRMSDAQLVSHATAIGVSETGINTILEIRNSPPALRMNGNMSWSGRMHSNKTGLTVQFSSLVPEYAAILNYEYDPTVPEFYEQPRRLSPRHNGRPYSYCPDLLVIGECEIRFEEWRREERLRSLAVKHPERFYQSDGQWRCDELEEAAREVGLDLRVRSSLELSPELARNADFLRGYLKGPMPPEVLVEAVRDLVRAGPIRSVAEVVEEARGIGASPDDVYCLIASGALVADLTRVWLLEPGALLFASRSEAEHSGLFLDHPPRRTPPLERPTTGQEVTMDHEPWVVVGTMNPLTLVSPASHVSTELSLGRLSELREEGRLSVAEVKPDT